MKTSRAVLPVLVSAVASWWVPAGAGEADVVRASASRGADGSWRFEVTVRHGDTGWDHYADRWDVVGPDGAVIASRVLHHPHENEQPFTRSLSGVRIGEGIGHVVIRAHDIVHGLGGAQVRVELAR